MVKVPLPSNTNTKRYHKTQAQNASTNGGRRVPRRENAMLIHYKQRLTDSTNYTHVCEPLS